MACLPLFILLKPASPMTLTLPHFPKRWAVALVTMLLLVAVAVPALALNVQPVIVDLQSTGRRTSAVVSLQNTFAETVPVEITVHPVRIVDGELQEFEDEEVEDLLIFPAQATLGPNQTQAFRIQWIGEPELAESRHFYVAVSQLPVALPENENAIQVLHRFKVLVSVGSPSASSTLEVVDAKIATDAAGKPRPVLTIRNSGGGYSYVANNRMTIVQRAPDGREAFRQTFEPDEIQQRMGLGLVPSGQTRTLPIGIELPQSDGTLSVELSPVETN